MPEERRDMNRSGHGAQKGTSAEKGQQKAPTPAARTVCGQHNSSPSNGGNSESTNEDKKVNRLCADLKEQVVVSSKLANGSVSTNSTAAAGMETQKGSASTAASSNSSTASSTAASTSSTATTAAASNSSATAGTTSSSSSSSSPKMASSSNAVPSSAANAVPMTNKTVPNADAADVDKAAMEAEVGSESPATKLAVNAALDAESVEPNNNHISAVSAGSEPPGIGREERPPLVKDVSPAKSIVDARSKTSTPQDQACYKTSRRACRSKSINGSPASYHTSLMGPAQPSMYTQTYPSTAHYYALYASSQSVPIACQRHDSSLQQFAYRHHATGAMNGEAREERLSTTNLFVRPLLETDTKETLIALVASAVVGGEKAVKSARVTHDRKQHSYGFIDFYQEDNARKALEFLSKDITIRQSRPGLEVKYARDSEKDDKNVYLSGVPTDFTDKDQLLQIFQPYGAIDSVHIMTNSSGDPTGVAFVRFNTTEDAERAIDAVKNSDVLINGKSVDAKFADRHSAEDKRRRRRQNISTATIYQNGAPAGLAAGSGIVNGYGSMTSAHHALASASPQPHLNMVIPSYQIRYYPTASGPAPFLSSSAPSSAATLGGTHSHYVPLHPGAAAAYQLGNANAAAQYPAATAALLGHNPNHTNAAGQAAAAISAAAALNAAAAGYHHPALSAVTTNGTHAPTHQSFVSPHDQATISAYHQYYTAMNGAAAGGYPVTENGTAGAPGVPVSSATAAYFQPATAQ